MKITTSTNRDYFIFSIEGDIDLYNASKLKVALFEAIIDKKMPKLIIDMNGIPYMDSTALGALVAAHRKMREYNGQLLIACVKDEVMEVLKLASLHRYFTIYRTIDDIINPPVEEVQNSRGEDETVEVTIVDNTGTAQSSSGTVQMGSNTSTLTRSKVPSGQQIKSNRVFTGNHAQLIDLDEVLVFKGWVDNSTFRIPADGFPKQNTEDELQRKIESKKAAIKRAQVMVLESLVGSFKHKNWMEFHKYRRKVYSKYMEIVRKGQAKLTKFDSKQNCSIIFEIKELDLKQRISTEF